MDLSSNIWTPPRFLQNLHGVPTSSPQLYFWKSIWKNHISCFNLHFVNINFKANFYTLSPNISKNQSNMCDPSHILVVNDLFVYLWLHQKLSKIKDIPKSLYFVIFNLTVVLVGFLLLRSKVKADAINDLQYCRAKMAPNSDMYVKYGPKVYFWEEYKYKHRGSRKTAP